jgi:hypothetical protein
LVASPFQKTVRLSDGDRLRLAHRRTEASRVPHRALRPRVLSFGAGPARPKFHGRCAPRRPGIQLRKYGKAQRRHAGTGSQPVRTRTCVITAPALDERTLPFLLSTQIQEKRHPFLGYVGP